MLSKIVRNLNNLYKIATSKKISIGEGLSSIFMVSILGSGLATVYIFHDFTTEKRIRDTFGLVHLEMEQKVQSLMDLLDQTISSSKEIKAPTWLVQKIEQSNKQQKDLNFKQNLQLYKNNRNYFLVKQLNLLENKVYRVGGLDEWLDKNIFRECECNIYFTNMNGSLLAANSLGINPLSVTERPLVRQFTDQTLNQLQSRFRGPNGRKWLGYYHHISGSNIVFFHEIRESKLFSDVILSLWGAGFFAFILSLGILWFIQFPIKKIVRPLRTITEQAEKIAAGNYKSITLPKGFGEVQTLSAAFSNMVLNLNQRDQKIAALIEEEKEKTRFEQELLVAQRVQENFLKKINRAEFAGVEVSTFYMPAEEVAGDWYGQHLCEETGILTLVVADVMGHGAGACLFTAALAALFEDYGSRAITDTSFVAWLNRANRVFVNLGKEKWSATLIAFQKKQDEDEIDIYCAGHIPPVFLDLEEKRGKKRPAFKLASNPLGVNLRFKYGHVKKKVQKGEKIVLFSDGIVEAPDKDGKMYGKKRMWNICRAEPDANSSDQLIQALMQDWRSFSEDEYRDDDFCLMVAKF